MTGEQGSGKIIVYHSEDGVSRVMLRAENGSVWLTQAQMAELYGTSIPNIVQIIRRLLAEREVDDATINSELIVRTEGQRRVRRELLTYNLDMILAVGYRVTTSRAVQFRQWATTVLREYLVKGFAINDEQLKGAETADYFDELLERIRDIRASEKRFYQKVRDLFAQTSADYVGSSPVAREFFATIQNTLLFAVTGHTAAELIVSRMDAAAPNAGLTTWKGARVRKADIAVAKNYLTSDEIGELNRITTRFLDFAEDRSRRQEQITMAQWASQTKRFIEFDERPLLSGPGTVSHAAMERSTSQRYEKFDADRSERETREADDDHYAEIERIVDSLGSEHPGTIKSPPTPPPPAQ
ncbi:MAG: virulence RhuM family protein [Rhodoglobus sp.]